MSRISGIWNDCFTYMFTCAPFFFTSLEHLYIHTSICVQIWDAAGIHLMRTSCTSILHPSSLVAADKGALLFLIVEGQSKDTLRTNIFISCCVICFCYNCALLINGAYISGQFAESNINVRMTARILDLTQYRGLNTFGPTEIQEMNGNRWWERKIGDGRRWRHLSYEQNSLHFPDNVSALTCSSIWENLWWTWEA